MAILNTGIPTNLTEYPNSFKRQGAFPLESFSVFYSMEAANTYASSNPVAYVGQNIVVVNGNEVDMYLITSTSGTLKKLASTTASGDLASDVANLQSEIENAKRGKTTLKESIEGMLITVDTTVTTEGAAKSYKLSQDGKDIVTIDIPKDMVISSGTIEAFTDENKPEGVETAGTYIVLTIANKTSDKLYINVSTLLDDKTVEGTEGEMITVEADSTNGPVKISASIVDGSITETKLTEEITNKLALAVSAIQKIETGTTNGTIKVDGVEISVFGLGEAAYKAITTDITEGSDALLTSGGAYVEIKKTNDALDEHISDTDIHVTIEEKTNWNDKYTKEEVDDKISTHTDNTEIHVTVENKNAWNNKYTKEEVDSIVFELNGAITDNINGLSASVIMPHINNTDVHVTSDDKINWNDKYTKTETDTAIATAIANAEHLKREIVTELPTIDIDEHTIYMIKKGSSESGDNYEEYMLIEDSLVKIGDTTVDLTDYLIKTGDASNTTVTLDETVTDENLEITSGEKLATSLAKIKNYFNSLHTVATTGDYNDLINKPKTTFITKETMIAGATTHNTTVTGEVTNIILTETNESGNSEVIIGDVDYKYNSTNNETVVNISFETANELDVEVKIVYIA